MSEKFCANPLCSSHIETGLEEMEMLLTNDSVKCETIKLHRVRYADSDRKEICFCSTCANAIKMTERRP